MITTVIRRNFEDSSKYNTESEENVLIPLVHHRWFLADQLCGSRESLKDTLDFNFKTRTLDSLAFHLNILFIILKYSRPFLTTKSKLIKIISNQYCPLLHKVKIAII